MLTERDSLLALSKASELGADVLRNLTERTGGAVGFFERKHAELEDIFKELHLTPAYKQVLFDVRKDPGISETKELLERENIRFITEEDPEYPGRLRNIFAPPLFLFIQGSFKPYERGIAVIGSRNCTHYGKEIALSFSNILARNGINIISGMAKGVDGFAHRGALSGDGRTIAVLGFGSLNCYPSENRLLKNQILEHGFTVSEYYPTLDGKPRFFPARNRIIAALSDGVLVVEAAKKSGTIITVDFALSLGRPIYAVPGRIGDPLSEGCNELIKHGCIPATDPGDILTSLGYCISGHSDKNKKNSLDLNEKKVYSIIDLYPKTADEIIAKTGVDADEVIKALFFLELSGLIKQPVTGKYIKEMTV